MYGESDDGFFYFEVMRSTEETESDFRHPRRLYTTMAELRNGMILPCAMQLAASSWHGTKLPNMLVFNTFSIKTRKVLFFLDLVSIDRARPQYLVTAFRFVVLCTLFNTSTKTSNFYLHSMSLAVKPFTGLQQPCTVRMVCTVTVVPR